MFGSVLHVKCQQVKSVKILSSNPRVPRAFNWQEPSLLLNRGQNIAAFLLLPFIFCSVKTV